MNEKIELAQANITFRKEGIIHIHYYDGLTSLKENKEIFYTIRKNCEWELSPILLSGNYFSNQDNEARAFNSSKEVVKHCSAIAILCDGLGQKISANFFINLIRPSVPTKCFNSEEEALKWLSKFKTIPKTFKQIRKINQLEKELIF
jgi:hypothetical protein